MPVYYIQARRSLCSRRSNFNILHEHTSAYAGVPPAHKCANVTQSLLCPLYGVDCIEWMSDSNYCLVHVPMRLADVISFQLSYYQSPSVNCILPLNIGGLKPQGHHQRVYGMGTSASVMLIPVTPPTQCVAECAKCGFSGQANTTWGPSPKRSPMQYNHQSYFGAYIRTKCTSQNLSRARKRVVV